MQKSNLFSTFAVLVSLAALGFLLYTFNFDDAPQLSLSPQQEIKNIKQSSLWKYQLADVLANQQFTPSDYEGKIIIIESSSPSCPQCVKQQQEILFLKNDLGDSIIAISFITDSGYDTARVQQYAQSNSFDWKFIVSKQANDLLKDSFGSGFLAFSANPIKLICPDGEIINFESGIKSASEIKEKIDSC